MYSFQLDAHIHVCEYIEMAQIESAWVGVQCFAQNEVDHSSASSLHTGQEQSQRLVCPSVNVGVLSHLSASCCMAS